MKKIDVILLGVFLILLSAATQLVAISKGVSAVFVFLTALIFSFFLNLKKNRSTLALLIFFTGVGICIGEIYRVFFHQKEFDEIVFKLFQNPISLGRIISFLWTSGIISITALATLIIHQPGYTEKRKSNKEFKRNFIFRTIAILLSFYGIYIKLDAMSEKDETRERASYYMMCLFILAFIVYRMTIKTSEQKQSERLKNCINPS